MSDHNKMLIDRIKGMPAQPGDLSEEIGWLLQEIDEQKAELDRLRAEVASLKAINDDLQQRLLQRGAELAKRQWQPIETAPKDGTDMLLYGPPARISTGWWADSLHGDHWSWDCDGEPTHWQPLPPPPDGG